MRINEHEWELVEGLNLPYQDEGKIHALHADAPAVVTLLILG